MVDVIFVSFVVMLMGGMRGENIYEENLSLLYDFLNTSVLFVLLWFYFTLFEGYRGQTLGKILFRIKVIKTDESQMHYEDALIRNFSKTILFPPVLLFFDLLFGKRGEGFLRYLDWYTKTSVIAI